MGWQDAPLADEAEEGLTASWQDAPLVDEEQGAGAGRGFVNPPTVADMGEDLNRPSFRAQTSGKRWAPPPEPEGSWEEPPKVEPEGSWAQPQPTGRGFSASARGLIDEPPAEEERSYVGASLKAGALDLVGVGAKLLDTINPFTTSADEAAVLYKNDPEGLKQFRQGYAGALSRVTEAMSQGAEQTMAEMGPEGQALSKLKYATMDPEKAAYLSGERVFGDALRSLPTSVGLGLSVYFTRGAAMEAEKAALAAGLSREAATQVAVMAGSRAMARWGAATEGAAGYAMGSNQVVNELQNAAEQKITSSPAYQRLIEEGYSPEAARERAIQMTASEAGIAAGVVDAAVNAMGGRVLGKILSEGGRLLPRVGKAGLTEAATETIQSGGEQLGENIATQRNIDPTQDLWKDVPESMAQGGVVGGVTGGAFGLFGRGPGEAPAPAQNAQQMVNEHWGPAFTSKPQEPTPRTDEEVAADVISAGTVDEAIAKASAHVDETEVPTAEQSDILQTMRQIQELEAQQGDETTPVSPFVPQPSLLAEEEEPLPPIDAGLMGTEQLAPPQPGEPGGGPKPWTGRHGAGYLTAEDALKALPSRQKAEGHLDWKLEQHGGRFQLMGYPRVPTEQPQHGVNYVSRNAGLQGLDPGAAGGGLPDAAGGLAAGMGADGAGGVPVLDGGGLPGQSAGEAVLPGAGAAPAPSLGSLRIKVDGNDVSLSLFDTRQLPDDSAARTSPGPVITQRQGDLMSQLGATLDKRVVFFDADRPRAPDGFVMDDDPNTLYINMRSGITPVAVLGHEFWHTVKKTDPEIHAALETVVGSRAKAKPVDDYYRGKLGYEQGQVLEELTSDLGGDLLNDPTFMPEVFQEIERRHGENARPMIAKLASLFNGLVSKVIKAFSGRNDFGSQQMVSEMETVRAAFRDGMATYLDARGIGRVAFEAEMIRSGRAQPAAAAAPVESKSRAPDTPEFKNWFKDSKAVDDVGDPLPLYHGTQADFGEFKAIGDGIFLTDSPAMASRYAEGEGGNVMPVYLSLKNPAPPSMVAKYPSRAKLRAMGYDGYVEQMGEKGTPSERRIFVAFKPEQIKSSTGNNGNFDPTSPKITESRPRAPDTPEFKKWFAGSAVVDEAGEPLTVYHGTSKSEGGEAFTMFDTYASNYGLMGQGSYFTSDPQVASEYTKKGRGDTPTVYPTHLSIKNPLDMEAKADADAWRNAFPDAEAFHEGGDTNESWYRAAEEALRDEQVPKYEGAEAMQEGIRSMGFDGITHMGGGRVDKNSDARHRVFIAFDPEQIKSSIGNRGTFDPTSPKITESRPRAPDTPEFKRWFAGSKVVDKAGEPLTVYHGTQRAAEGIERFGADSGYAGQESAGLTWFTSSPRQAAGYASWIKAQEEGEVVGNPTVYPTHLALKNPARLADLQRLGIDEDPQMALYEKGAVDKLKAAGFDGVMWTTGEYTGSPAEQGDDTTFVAFRPEQIKSAIGNRGTFDPASPKITESKPRFYSQLQRAIESVPDKIATMSAPSWRAWIDSNSAKLGAKKDEIEFSGLKEYLALKGKDKVSREEISAFLDANGVQVETKVLGSRENWRQRMDLLDTRGRSNLTTAEREELDELQARLDEEGRDETPESQQTKFDNYTVPGGQNYREVLLTLPKHGETAKSRRLEAAREERKRVTAQAAELRRAGQPVSELATRFIELGQEINRLEQEVDNEFRREGSPKYLSSHWDEPNVVAHIRADDRTDVEGKKVFFIHEIQSDWGQAGKKARSARVKAVAREQGIPEEEAAKLVPADYGFGPGRAVYKVEDRDGRIVETFDDQRDAEKLAATMPHGKWHKLMLDVGVPHAPFVQDTKAWVALAVKRAIMLAVEGGHDKVAFVNGEQAADFFDLRKQVDYIDYWKKEDGTYGANWSKDGRESDPLTLKESELEAHFGKEVAKHMADGDGKPASKVSFSGPQEWKRLEGDYLKVGGEGMKGFYDGIVPQVANDVLKKLGGGKVGPVEIPVTGKHFGRYDYEFEDGEFVVLDFERGARGTEVSRWPTKARAVAEVDLLNSKDNETPKTQTQLGFDITPEMRERVGGQGVPLFSKDRTPGSDAGHKREKGSGRYVGAPDWVGNSPQQLAVLRKKLRSLAVEGESGRYWYENSSKAVLQLVGGDKIEAEKFVALLAIFSQGTSVDANTTFALTAYYQWKAGLPIHAGRFPTAQSKKAEDILRRDTGWGGVKTNNFHADLMEEIDPSKVDSAHATMDMWMALAFDYGSKVLDQGPKYGFAKAEIEHLAKELGWKPHQVQAAIWTSIKARIESTEKLRNATEKQQGVEAGSYEHFRLAHKLGMEANLTPEQIAATYFDFASALEQHAIQMSWEATPSHDAATIPGIFAAPVDQKFEYLAAVQEALTEDGRDQVAEAVGAPQGLTVVGASAWQGEVGAGAQTFLAGAMETRESTPEERAEGMPKQRRAIRPVAREVLDLYAAARGYVLSQDAVVYHTPIWADAIGRHNGIAITTQRAPTVEEVGELYRALIEKFGTTELAPGFRPDGVRILNFVEGISNKEFHDGVREVLEALPENTVWHNGEASTFRSEGGYVGNNWKDQPNGEGYLAEIEARRPDLLGRLADLRARVAAVNEDFARRYGWGSPEGAAADDTGAEEVKLSKARTDTPEFKHWFGDSKAVDADGKPLVVYHGSPTPGITEFDAQRAGENTGNRGWFGEGIYFTASRDFARGFMRHISGRKTGQGKVYAVYLSLQNPYVAGLDGRSNVEKLRGMALTAQEREQLATWWKNAQRTGRDTIIDLTSGKGALGGDWLRQVIERNGYDGVIAPESPSNGDAEYVAFRSSQVKSVFNDGSFDPENPNISMSRPRDEQGRFARHRPSNATPTWVAPDVTRTDKILFETQDSRIDLRRAQEAIARAGGQIAEPFDARLAETLYAGRVADRTEVFLKTEAEPLLKLMASTKVGLTELGDYLLARHAPERNAHVASVNPAMPDGGAGSNSHGTLMTNAAARQYLAQIPATRRAQLAAVAREVDKITAGTRRLLVAEGLEKQETIDAWEAAYPNYAPLFKDEETGNPHPIGSGFKVKGSSSKRATGSEAEVTHVLSHVLMQREAAITRAEKNRVGIALYGLALTNPNPDFWTVIRPNMSPRRIQAELQAMGLNPANWAQMDPTPTIRSINKSTGLVQDTPDPMYKNRQDAIVLRVDGEDRVLLFNTKDPRAMRLASDLNNMDGLLRTEVVAKTVGRATRWFASVNTQYNPAFGLVNFTRDVMGGTMNLTNTPLRGQKTRVLASTPAALVGISRSLRGDPNRTPWSDLWEEFKAVGGRTGYRELFRTADERARKIENELKSIDRLTAGRAAHAVLDLMDDFNTSLENAVRLSAYKAGLDKGMSKAAAARLARELTVDFNRKGRTGRELGSLYAFLNASIQGMERTMRTIAGPAGKRIIAGGLALGALQALMLAAAGFEEDDLPEYVKARAFIIPVGGDKRYIAIPLALGFHVLPNTGRVLTELGMSGGKDAGKKTVEALGELLGAFNPLGGGNVLTAHGLLTTVLPTVLDPFADVNANKNFAGRPIEREAFEHDNRPGYERARETTMRTTTGQVYLGISKAINSLFGGTKYEAGGVGDFTVSPTPEMVRYWAQQVGGGVLREVEKSIDSSVAALKGEEVEPRMIPVSSRFVGQVDQEHATQAAYYDATNRMKKIQSSHRAAKKAGDDEALKDMEKRYPVEIKQLKKMGEVDRKLRELNTDAKETVGDRKRLAEIDAERTAKMKEFNEAVIELEKEQAKAGATSSGSSR